jgi:hypothetical protein
MATYTRAQIVDGTGFPAAAVFWQVDDSKIRKLETALYALRAAWRNGEAGCDSGADEDLATAVGNLLKLLS